MQIFPFTQKEIKLFRELNRHKIPYLIVGLASAALQGAPIVTKDVDIWFKDINDELLQKILRKCGAVYIPSVDLNPPALAGKDFNLLDIVTHVHGVDIFDNEYKKSLKVKAAGVTLKLLPLEKIIKSKEFLHRKKDILVLSVLRDALISKKTAASPAK